MRRGGIVDTKYHIAKHSKHNHTYVCFDCDPDLKELLATVGMEVIELGNDSIDAAIEYMKENADAVHANNSGGAEPGAYIGMKSGKPTLLVYNAPAIPTKEMNYDLITIITVSHGILQLWPPEMKPYRVIYNCAQDMTKLSSMSKRDCKLELGFDADRPVVGRLGRLEGLKRPQDFIRAAADISEGVPTVQFLLAGGGANEEGIRGMADALKNATGVDIKTPGFLTGMAKYTALNAIDVFLYPTSAEGFGKVFAEAMSLGIPIVTYSDPVNIDVVGPAGLFASDNEFVKMDKPFNALSRLTIDLLSNEREYNKLSVNGRRLYEERYTPEMIVGQYDEVYEEIT